MSPAEQINQASGLSREELGTERMRVMIVDDNTFFAKCVTALINHEPDMQVSDVARDYVSLESLLEKSKPNLLLIDVSLGYENGLEVARRLRCRHVDTPILLTSSMAHPSPRELREIGRCEFVSKYQRPADFIGKIRECLSL